MFDISRGYVSQCRDQIFFNYTKIMPPLSYLTKLIFFKFLLRLKVQTLENRIPNQRTKREYKKKKSKSQSIFFKATLFKNHLNNRRYISHLFPINPFLFSNDFLIFSYFLFYYGELEDNQSNTIIVIDRLIESGSTRQKGFEVYSLCRSICVGLEQTQFIWQDRNSFGSPQLGHRDTPTGRVNFKISLSLFRLEDNVESFVYSF